MFKKVFFLIASISTLLLCSAPVSATSISPLEQISEPSESIEINTPEEGYDFDVNFIAKNQNLEYKTTITNDEEYPVKIESINLNTSVYDFFEYSYDGISVDDVIEVGETKDLIISVKTNSNNTSTVSEDYNLTITYSQIKPTPDPEDPNTFENPETSATTIIKSGAIVLISAGVIIFIFARNKRIRHFIILFAVTTLGICLLAGNAIAEEDDNILTVLGKVRYTNIYTVTVDPNGGTYDSEDLQVTRREGETYHIEAVNRDHFTFVEWEINPSNTPDENNDLEIHADTTLKAKWNEKTYILTIKPNGGRYLNSESDWSQSYRPNEKETISTPEKEGYNFAGWTVEEGHIGQNGHFSGDEVTMTENITLVANWEIKTFTVTVIPNGGTYSGELKTTVNWGDNYEIQSITRTDYDLKNWTQIIEEASTTLDADTESINNITADVVLEANWWSSIFHTVRINPNGGAYDGNENITTERVRHGTNYTMKEATKTFYALAYWDADWQDSETNTQVEDGEEFTVNSDVDLTAVWYLAVARIERTQKLYPSIMSAHRDANPGDITGDIITLLVDVSEIVTNSKEVTLDLNQHTVYGYLNNTADGNITLINGEINNFVAPPEGVIDLIGDVDSYDTPIKDAVNPDGAAVINNGSLTMGVDNYEENDGEQNEENKEAIIDNNNIRLIGNEVGLQQNNYFYFYDGFIEGNLGLIGGYDGSPWYRDFFDNTDKHYFPFVTPFTITENETDRSRQHVELSKADKAVSRTSVHGDIYYYNLQDNINTSAKTGYKMYAVRDFDASHVLDIASEGEDIEFDITGHTINLGDNVTVNGKLTITDSKPNGSDGLLTSSKTIFNNNQLNIEGATIKAHTANTLLQNSGILAIKNSTLESENGNVIIITGDNPTINADTNSYIRAKKSNTSAIVNDSTNFTLASGNIEGYNCSVQNNSGKKLTMTGGSINGTQSALCNWGGTVNIEDGTVKTLSTENNYALVTEGGNVNIKGGIVESDTRANDANNNYPEGYAIRYNGNNSSTTVTVTGGTIKATSATNYRIGAVSGFIGTFNFGGIKNNDNTISYSSKEPQIIVKSTGNANAYAFAKEATSINIYKGTIDVDAVKYACAADWSGNKITMTGGNVKIHSQTEYANGFAGLGSSSYGPDSFTMSGGSIDVRTDNPNRTGVALSNWTTIITDGNVYGNTYGIHGYYNQYNVGNITIGDNNDAKIHNGQDGDNTLLPIIQGGVNAIYKGNVSFYDGILKGGAASEDDITYVDSPETIHAITDGTKQIITNYEGEQDCWLEEEKPYLIIENDPERTTNSLSKAFEMAENNETIYATRDVTTESLISANTKNITLDLAGHKLEYTQTIPNNGTLTIVDSLGDGSITNTNTSKGAITNSGELKLNSGTISGYACVINNGSQKEFTMTGGSVRGTESAICNDYGEVNIEGGTVKTVSTKYNSTLHTWGGTINIDGGIIESETKANNNNSNNTDSFAIEVENGRNETINFTGGTIKATSSANGGSYGVRGIKGSGGTFNFGGKKNNDGTISLSNKEPQLIVESTGSANAYAFEKTNSSINIYKGTIKVDAINYAGAQWNPGATTTMMGGSITIRSKNGNAGGFVGASSYGYGSFIMSDGSLDVRADAPDKTGIGINTGTVTVTDGSVYGSTYGIKGYYTDSNITIGDNNDAKIHNGQDGDNTLLPIIQGGVNAIYTGNVSFYDGILKGGAASEDDITYVNDPEIVRAVPDGASRIITNYENEQDCWLKEDLPYIHVESNGEDYSSLTKALRDAASTDTFTILRSASTNAVLPAIEKDITIELDGNTLNYTQPLINSAKLVIKDTKKTGGITNDNPNVSTIQNNGTFTLESGTIYNYSCAIQNNSGKTSNITGGTVTGVASAICNSYGTVNINGGVVEAVNNGLASTDTIYTYGGTINAYGGLIQAKTTSDVTNYSGETKVFGTQGNSSTTINITNAKVKASTNRSNATVITGNYITITIESTDNSSYITAENTGTGNARIYSGAVNDFTVSNGNITAEATNGNAYISSSDQNSNYIMGGNITIHSVGGNAYGFTSSTGNSGSKLKEMTGGSLKVYTDNPDKVGIALTLYDANITGGYIYGSTYGIENTTTATIGKNGDILYNGQNGTEAKPVIVGGSYAVHNGNAYFYDGILKGGIDGYWDRNIKAIADQTYMHQGSETIEGVNYITKYLAKETDLAKIGTGSCEDEGTACYPSIQAAINASSENDTIKLLQDNYVFSPIIVSADKKFTLDTCGFNIITGSRIENNGNMKIVNSQKATSNPLIEYHEYNRFFLNKTGGTLHIEDIKLQGNERVILAQSDSTTIVKNTEIKTTSNSNNVIESEGKLEITFSKIYGGVLSKNGQFSITNSEIERHGKALIVTNSAGTISKAAITNTNGVDEPSQYAYWQDGNNGNVSITNETTITGAIYASNSGEGHLSIKDSVVQFASNFQYPLIESNNQNNTIILDNTTARLTQTASYRGWDYATVIYNKGTMEIKNESTVELKYDTTSTIPYEGCVVDNRSDSLTVENSHLKNNSIHTTYIQNGEMADTGQSYGILNRGNVSFSGSDIQLTRNTSYGIYNVSGDVVIKSGEIKAGGKKARGLWIKTGGITMGEAEPANSPNYGKAEANVSTTDPYIEAITTSGSDGIGVTMETGSFNFFDGKILQNVELGPALKSNGIDKATVTEVEYLYQPEKHQDENGHYYYILEFMRN